MFVVVLAVTSTVNGVTTWSKTSSKVYQSGSTPNNAVSPTRRPEPKVSVDAFAVPGVITQSAAATIKI